MEGWSAEECGGSEKPAFSPMTRKSILGSGAALGAPGALGRPAAPSQGEVSTNSALFLAPPVLPVLSNRALKPGSVSFFRWGDPLE